MLEKINSLKNWQVFLLIAVVGLIVYGNGLGNPFQGDDLSQIVNNVPVHSISNIKLFFEGGTYYNGPGVNPLTGPYYRPLMTVTFSVIYSLFGPHPIYFHAFQLFICLLSVFLLYLFFKYFFNTALSLFLALLFLVHPINSQVIYSIPNMQDALFFFFGILSLWLILKFRSMKSLILISLCLMLSLFSKESGIVFVPVALLLLLLSGQKKKLFSLLGILIIPLALYLILRENAVRLYANPINAPIDLLSLTARLFTMPSIVSFYFLKFLIPVKLASAYYWDYSKFSIIHVLVPLLFDIALAACALLLLRDIKKRKQKSSYFIFGFFLVWFILGLSISLQFIPLDMTASESYFYFPLVGVLGMIGVIASEYKPKVKPEYIFAICIAILLLFAARSFERSFDWRSQYVLALHDISSSRQDYDAYNYAAQYLIGQDDYNAALPYAQKSVALFPTELNNVNLGAILTYEGEYNEAFNAYQNALKYGNDSLVYEDMAILTLFSNSENTSKQFLLNAVQMYPQDSTIRMYLALFEDKHGDNYDAKISIINAAKYGSIPKSIYDSIINNESFNVSIGSTQIRI